MSSAWAPAARRPRACKGGAEGARHGDPERAARLFGAGEALYEKTGTVPAFPATQALYERDLASVRAQLDIETLEAAWAQGRAMTLEEVVTEALAESTQPPVSPFKRLDES